MSLSPTFSLVPEPSGPLLILGLSDAQGSAAVELSLVIPTYNEAQTLPSLLEQLSALLGEKYGDRYELILVDDDSPDRTWQIAQQLTAQYPALRVLRRERERGLATAVVRGWQVARGRLLGVMDGDLQHPPATLLTLLTALEQGADLAVASRHAPGGGVSQWNWGRRLLSRGAQLLGLLLLPEVVGRLADPMSGYFVVRRGAIGDRQLYPSGYKIGLEVLGRGDIHRIAEVGYVFQARQQGASKISLASYGDYLLHLLRLRLARLWPRPLQKRQNTPVVRQGAAQRPNVPHPP